jgi:hypothetical protein
MLVHRETEATIMNRFALFTTIELFDLRILSPSFGNGSDGKSGNGR